VLAAALVGCAQPGPEEERTSAIVSRVGDGDTLDVRSGARVRLVQIDAPELGAGECYAREARRELERLVPPGSRIELEADARLDDADRYGRRLRYVHTTERNVNVVLVHRGAAVPYFRRGEKGRYADDLLRAVEDARRARRGMWGACRVSWLSDRAVTTRRR
jgi:micrococcal nuclease